LTIGENDIEQLFAREQQPKPPAVQPSMPTVSLSQTWEIGDDDTYNRKRDIRARKEVETAALNDEDKAVDDGKNDQESET
jgi:hypothetical protein